MQTATYTDLVAALEQIVRLGREGATTLPNGDPMSYALADIAEKALRRGETACTPSH